MKILRLSLIVIFSSFLFGSLFLTSCTEDESPRATIFVYKLDPMGNKLAVSNCEVRLDPPSGTTQPDLLEYTDKPLMTDVHGMVEYEFKYEGIIPVKAQKGTGAESCGMGVIILKINEVYEESIRLSACYD